MCSFKPRGRKLFLAILIVLLFAPGSFAYYAPLQDVTAWVDGATVRFKVYDPALGKWMEDASTATTSVVDLRVQEGIVVWEYLNAAQTLSQSVAVYDPLRESWRKQEYFTGRRVKNIIIKDGIVFTAYEGRNDRYVIYDAVIGGWVIAHFGYSDWSDCQGFRAGVGAASFTELDVHYVLSLIYNSTGHSWYKGIKYTKVVACPLNIDEGGTVSWTDQGATCLLGYDHSKGWYSGPTQPLACFAAPAISTGYAWFTDMSLGATAWHLDFGDGTTSNLRSTVHNYNAEGTYIVTQTVTGPAGSNTTTRTVMVDKTPPPTGTIVINNGSQYTNNPSVALSLSATDVGSGVAWMRFSNNGATWGNWAPYKTSYYQYTLTPGDGTKKVYVQFKDAAGFVSGVASDSIILETTPPAQSSISINAGAKYTNSPKVTLSLFAKDQVSGVTHMRLSNDGSSWTAWKGYATSFGPWTLTAGDGTKIVAVQFRDKAGNVSSTKSDTIIFDTTAPYSCSIVINADAVYTNSRKVTLSLHADDSRSMVKFVRFRQYDLTKETPWGTWLNYLTSRTFDLLAGDGRKWVEAKFMDGAGNVSGIVNDTTILDATPPTGGSLTAVGGNRQVTLKWSGFTDALSGIQNYLLYFSTQPFSLRTEATKIYQGTLSTFTHPNLTPNTIYYYRVYAQDQAGNISAGKAAQATTQ